MTESRTTPIYLRSGAAWLCLVSPSSSAQLGALSWGGWRPGDKVPGTRSSLDPPLDQIPAYSFPGDLTHLSLPTTPPEHLLVHFLLSAIGEEETNFAPQLLADLQNQRRVASVAWEQWFSAGDDSATPTPQHLATPGEDCEGAEAQGELSLTPAPGPARQLEGATPAGESQDPPDAGCLCTHQPGFDPAPPSSLCFCQRTSYREKEGSVKEAPCPQLSANQLQSPGPEPQPRRRRGQRLLSM